MIRLTDGWSLAATKLRTRPIRTTLTVLIASMLFGVLVLATLLVQGGIDSLKRFSAGGLTERYLAMASYHDYSSDPSNVPTSVMLRANQIYTKLIADKTAAAKKLGAQYDPASEPKPVTKQSGQKDYLDFSSPAADQAISEYYATLPSAKQVLVKEFKTTPTQKVYSVEESSTLGYQSKMIVAGKEAFSVQANSPQNAGNSDLNFGWSYIDQSVVESFMLPSSQLSRQQNVSNMPVIAPFSKVEAALGLKKLSKGAPAKARLERLQYVRDNAHTATFVLCYRNNASQSQIESAISAPKEIEAAKAQPGYQRPSLQYGLPEPGGCKPASVIRDVRTSQEKAATIAQNKFEDMFGTETEPVQQLVKFRVVGISPNGFGAESFSNVGSLIETLAGSSLQGQWVVPQQMYDAMPNKSDYARFAPISTGDKLSAALLNNSATMILEFTNAADVKQFVEKFGCTNENCNSKFFVQYFGSNSVLLDEARREIAKILGYVALGIGVIAAIIMMGMIGRVIGDSRRETAVFRAIGARRNDIRLIYIEYTLALSAIVALASILLGTVTALVINAAVSPDFTVQAHLVYLFSDDNLTFSLVGIWWQALAAILGMVMLAGLVGMLLPLARNLGRSPIKDMRDDT